MSSIHEKKIGLRERPSRSFAGKPLQLSDILEATGLDSDSGQENTFSEKQPASPDGGVFNSVRASARAAVVPDINVELCSEHGSSNDLHSQARTRHRSQDTSTIPLSPPSSALNGYGGKKLGHYRKISLNHTLEGVDRSTDGIIARTGPAPGTILSTDTSLTRYGIGSIEGGTIIGVASPPRKKNSVGARNSRSPPSMDRLKPNTGLKRVPSSLFYLDYADDDDDDDDNDDEDDHDDYAIDITKTRARMPIGMSRKMSAMQYISFEKDEVSPEEEIVKNNEVIEEPKQVESADQVTETETIDVKSLALCYEDSMKEIDTLMSSFRLGDQFYEEVMTLLNIEFDRGLVRSTCNEATVKMYPTYIRALPDGSESGMFVALDLGGTNFRVLLVDLKGRETPDVKSKVFLIPTSIMLGPGVMLFDHIVTCISEFLTEHGMNLEHLTMGFTFSFPCCQKGIASAKLVQWTKGFKCSDVESHDVVQLLQEAIDRRGDLSLECVAIINDNVGVLMTGARSDPNCSIGLILGTGTNCCYMEDLKNVELWDEDMESPSQVIINTEWGAFGDSGCLDFIRNRFDHQLDVQSLNAGRQLFEKMISGMYMGEIVRLVLCELTERKLLFQGVMSDELNEPNRFYTKYISEIESDGLSGEFTNTKMILEELSLSNYTSEDCRYVQHVCWQVSQRAANLAAAAVATIIIRLQLSEVTIAVDGSLYRFHPHFKDLMSKKISRLIRPWQQFKLTLAHDGSGQGAALVAAVAKRCIEAKKLVMAK